jgi:hypothetical protein
MYIYAFSNHTEIVKDKLSDKKSLLGKRFNRTDNFINLTLLGAQRCVGDISLNRDSSIYLASKNGNLNTTIKVFDSIFIKDRLPMPFNFLNSVNASKLFFLAKNFGIEGKTLFVDRFESALPQAFVDVKQGKTVLLGVVKEAIADLDLHKKRFGAGEIEESSRWLILSSQLNDIEPIAKISDLRLTPTTKSENTISELFSFLESGDEVFDFRGENLSFRVKVPLKI